MSWECAALKSFLSLFLSTECALMAFEFFTLHYVIAFSVKDACNAALEFGHSVEGSINVCI